MELKIENYSLEKGSICGKEARSKAYYLNKLKNMTYSRQFLQFGTIFLILLTATNPSWAQIVPDTTLPVNTIVNPQGTTIQITGGTKAGSNLFHSFGEFSLPTASQAFFNNSLDIQNIFSRVTGGQASNIDGTIRANGSANLFLINPKGIIFGPNASLNLGGSFLGTTANSIKFASGEFSATNPKAPPLLTVNLPIGLQFGANPGNIVNQSQATSPFPLPPINSLIPIPTNVGLQVQPGQTLALIGGDLILENGNLTAFNGNIQLGSVANPGLVGFSLTSTGPALDYSNIAKKGNIQLSGQASVNASGLGGGSIFVAGGNITLGDRANITSDTVGSFDGRGITIDAAQLRILDQAYVAASSAGKGAGGDLAIRATEFVEIRGIGFENFLNLTVNAFFAGDVNLLSRESGLYTGTIADGNSGKITIETPQLRMLEGGIVLSPTFGKGLGGNIDIRAPQSVDVSGSGLLTTAFGQGNAGKLTIDTGKLTIRDQSSVSTATFGAGNSGDIIVRATDSVVMLEKQETSDFGTNLSTTTIGSSGNAGNIEITTRSLLLQDGATIASASGATSFAGIIRATGKGGDVTINASESVTVTGTSDGVPYSRSQIVTATLSSLTPEEVEKFGTPDAGKLTINTKRLIIKDGGGVGASTVGTGKGGDVFINASELVEVSGKTKDGRSPSGLATASGDLLLEALYPGQLNPTGNAGTVNITTDKLIVRDGGSVNVGTTGTGNPGSINVVGKTIFIDNNYVDIDVPNRKGNIDANTTSGKEGDINLQAQEILLRRGALISTNAGSTDGGNIKINTDILLAVPSENSDITANAQKGSGGSVNITASGIFGLKYQLTTTPNSDITATSDLGPQFNGIVIFNIVGTNPSQGLVELPENTVDPSRLIATGCPTDRGNSFVITGRGGLPEDPSQTLRGKTIWQDLRSLEGQGPIVNTPKSSGLPVPKTQNPIVEATGWILNAKGEVELVAPGTQNSPQTPLFRPANCYTLNSQGR